MTGYCSGYGIGQQQKILHYRSGSVVQEVSYPDQLFIIHDCSTALRFCVVAKQREPYIVCVVTETDIVCNVNETYIVWIVTATCIVCIVTATCIVCIVTEGKFKHTRWFKYDRD
jgi:hypothetical protein